MFRNIRISPKYVSWNYNELWDEEERERPKKSLLSEDWSSSELDRHFYHNDLPSTRLLIWARFNFIETFRPYGRFIVMTHTFFYWCSSFQVQPRVASSLLKDAVNSTINFNSLSISRPTCMCLKVFDVKFKFEFCVSGFCFRALEATFCPSF